MIIFAGLLSWLFVPVPGISCPGM